MDFNIYDLFKDTMVEGGSIDASKILIKNLEQKFTQKNVIIKNQKIKLINYIKIQIYMKEI